MVHSLISIDFCSKQVVFFVKFFNKNKRDIINKLLNNYRSGLFHPLLDKNWKEKISKYLEFIHEMRMSVKHYYMD